MKLIFLDIDGVCNCATTKERCGGYIGVEQEKIALVKQIVEATGAKIVLTSTWRLDWLWFQSGKMANLTSFNYLKEEFAKQGLEFFDFTPSHQDGHRGKEVQDWISKCEDDIESYVVIDDDIYDIALEHRGHVIQTSWKSGLKPNAVKWAIQILENKKE